MALVENKNLPIFFKEKEITKQQLDQLKDVLRDAINQLNDISSANTVSITTLNNIVLPAINIVTQSLEEFDQAKADIATILAQAAAIQVALTQIGTEVAYQAQIIALGGQLLQLLQAFNAAEGVLSQTTASAIASAATLQGIVVDGTVRVKKAEATQDSDPVTLTAASVIRQTADRVDQDLTSTNENGPTFQKVTVEDKELTKTDLTNYDTAYDHSQITDGTNPHGTTALAVGFVVESFTGFLSDTQNVESALVQLDTHDHDDDYVKLTQLGVATDTETGVVGVATLNEEGFVDESQLPSYVDDIVKFETYAELPETGSLAKIYIVYNDPTESLNTSYRWDGDDYFPFDEKHAQWGFISGDILEQTDIEQAVYTPLVGGLIADETIGEAIQALDEELGKVIDGTTDIAFSDEDITATFVATAISEVQDNVDATNNRIDDIEDGTTDITFSSEDLSSITLREAIEEVQSNVETVAGDLADVVNGTTNIDFEDTDITATTIAGAISELRNELDTTEDNVNDIINGVTPISIDVASTTDLTSTDIASTILEIYAQKGAASGFATLDSNSRIPAEQLPLEAIEFKGTFGSAGSTTEGDLPSTGNNPGDLYLCDTNAYASTVAGITFESGDKALWDGSAWVRNAARDSVVSVNTKSGAVTLDTTDIATVTTNFNGKLTSLDDTVQLALDTLDDHTHAFDEITSTPTTLSGYGIADAYTIGATDALLAGKVDVDTLSSSLTLYPTTTAEVGGTFDGYFQMVSSPGDTRYNTTEVNVYTTDNTLSGGTSLITSEDPEAPSVVAGLVADAGLFVGDLGIINAVTIGELRHASGNRFARFRYKIFKSDNMVNPIAVSEYTPTVTNTTFQQYFEFALVNNGVFTLADRLVIVYEAYKPESGGNNPIVSIKFGGVTPTRTNLPIPVNVTQNAALITYDPSTVSLLSNNVQAAIDELSAVVDSNTTQIRVEQFKIISDDNEDDTFTYRNSNNIDIVGAYVGGWYEFTLELSGFYAGGNLVWTNINDEVTYFLTDTTNLEEGTPDINNIVTKVRVSHGFVNGDEIDIVYYQGVNIAAAVINDGSVTFPKLDNTLQAQSTLVAGSTAAATANQLVRRDASGNFSANEITATIDGKFKTARAITLSGDVSGTANFDGSAGITITTVVADNSHSHLTTDITGLQDVIDSISSVKISATAPEDPNEEDLWWNSVEGVLYIYYNDGESSQWVAISSGTAFDAEDIAYENTASGLAATQVQAAIDELADEKSSVDYYTTTIADTDWTGSEAPYTAVKTVSGLLSTDRPIVDLDLSAVAIGNVAAKQADWALVYRAAATDTDELSFFATEEPTESLVIQIKVVR
jgi:hypothetical protein